jgi:hypothetical protein
MEVLEQSLFLSYAWSDDQPFVQRLCKDLRLRGYEVWMDTEDMPTRGRTLPQEIAKQLDDCGRVITVIGPGAIKSDACQAERQYAFERGKVVTAILRLGDYKSLPT